MSNTNPDLELRVVQFTDPRAFADALLPYDDFHMNFGLGFVLDSLNPSHPKANDFAPETRRMFGVYWGEDVV